ncbi:MAG: hypothetical protein ACK460_18000, partial [Microcystis sp.]|uniref:hypothetical protein n=1 Tax=Microcystis sp. TaxID=1127 RepID=UPI00391D6A0F
GPSDQFFQFSFVNSLVIKHLDPSKWLDKSKVNRGVRSQESGVRSQESAFIYSRCSGAPQFLIT